MKLITVTTDEQCSIYLYPYKKDEMPCVEKEYSEDEVKGFKENADEYVLATYSSGSSHDSYSRDVQLEEISFDKYVIEDGKLIGFMPIKNEFLPIDRTDYVYHSYGGSHTLSSGSEKYFLVRCDEIGGSATGVFSMESETGKTIGEVFKKVYSSYGL